MLFRLGVPSFIFGIIGAFPFAYIFGKTYAITKDSLHLVFEYTYSSNLLVVITGVNGVMVLNFAKKCCQNHISKWILFFVGWVSGLTILTTIISATVF